MIGYNKLKFADDPENAGKLFRIYYQFPTGIYQYNYIPGASSNFPKRDFTREDRGRPETKLHSWIPIEKFTPICLI